MQLLRVEFHCHTIASEDSITPPARLVEAARQKGLERVIVTDHNTIRGAAAAQRLDPERIVIGEEIMTTRGEILAAFVREEIPAGLSPEETIRRLREQGAFISVSHPFDRGRKGAWREADLLAIAPGVDAIEVFNSRCKRQSYNPQARTFAEAHGMAGTVGSDAHVTWELGRAVMLLEPFEDGEELRQAVRRGRAEARWSMPLIHATSGFARICKRMRIGLDMNF